MKEQKPPQLERKAQVSALWFYGRMYVIFIFLPLMPLLLRFVMEAALWCYVLAKVPGIVFSGGFREALALSLCLQVIITFVDLGIRVCKQAVSKYKKADSQLQKSISEEKLSPVEDRLATEMKGDWRGTLKMLGSRFITTALILFMLSLQFPLQLSFASPLYLMGCAFLLTIVFYLHLTFLKETMLVMLEKVKKQSNKFKSGEV